MTQVTAEALRARCDELHELETMEPEDVYQTVANEFDISMEEFFDLMADEETE